MHQDNLSGLARTSTNEALSLNAVSRDKKSASVRQADVATHFCPIDPDKKSAVLRQKNRLVWGGLKTSFLTVEGSNWRVRWVNVSKAQCVNEEVMNHFVSSLCHVFRSSVR